MRRARHTILIFLTLLFLLFTQVAASLAPKPLPPLRDALIQPDEIEYPNLIPVSLGHGVNVTPEMQAQCGLDCVKRFWGGRNSLTIMMSRTASKAAADQAAQNILTQYRAWGNRFYESQTIPCSACDENETIQTGQVLRSDRTADIVSIATHGPVWLVMTFHLEYDGIPIYTDYCQNETCWQSELLTHQLSLNKLMDLQHRKLASLGYEPIPANLEPVRPYAPTPTPPTLASNVVNQLDPFAASPMCQLPCLNGLEPGKSNREDMDRFFTRLGSKSGATQDLYGDDCLDLSKAPGGNYSELVPQICVTLENNTVQSIELKNWNHPEQFYPKRIASRIGIPDKILAFHSHGVPGYALALYYPKIPAVVIIRGDLANNSDVCMGDRRKQTANLLLYPQNLHLRYEQPFLGTETAWSNFLNYKNLPLPVVFDQLADPNRCLKYDR